jgi:hypothetical protein
MPDVPRQPEFYYPSTHATLRKKERNIPWQKVSKTIANGRIKDSPKEDCKIFVKQFERDTLPVGVVADYECGEIITIEWRK